MQITLTREKKIAKDQLGWKKKATWPKMSDRRTGGVCDDACIARAGVPGGHGRDNGGGGAGGATVPHLCTTCGRCVQWDMELV